MKAHQTDPGINQARGEMGKGSNVSKATKSREKAAEKAAKEGKGGGGKEGMASRKPDNLQEVMAAEKAERDRLKKEKEERERKKKEDAERERKKLAEQTAKAEQELAKKKKQGS